MSVSTASTTAYTTVVTAPVGGWRRELPLEMFYMIFEWLAYSRSLMELGNCSLTCRRWTSEAQKLLFKNAQFYISVPWYATNMYFRAGDIPPVFVPYICTSISPVLISAISSVYLYGTYGEGGVIQLLQAVQNFPQLETLTIHNLTTRGIADYVDAAPVPSVKEIHLIDFCTHKAHECLFRFLILFPNLQRLSLDGSNHDFYSSTPSLPSHFEAHNLPRLETLELIDIYPSAWSILDTLDHLWLRLKSLLIGQINDTDVNAVNTVLNRFGPNLEEVQLCAFSGRVPITYPGISSCDNLRSLHLCFAWDNNSWLADVCETMSAISSKGLQQMRVTVDVILENYVANVAEEGVDENWHKWGRIINLRPSIVVIIQVSHDCEATAGPAFDTFLKGIEQARMELDKKDRLEVLFRHWLTIKGNPRCRV